MVILAMTDIRVGERGGSVVVEVPIDRRRRSIIIEPHDAIQVANQIATSAVRLIDRDAPAAIDVFGIALIPYGTDGRAALKLSTVDHGPFVFQIEARDLEALAEAARGALEHAALGGSA